MSRALSKTEAAIRHNLQALRRYAEIMRAKLSPSSDPAAVDDGGAQLKPATRRSIGRHVAAITVVATLLVGSVGVMGGTMEVSGAVIALGSLVVESSVKKVQHPTGGIIGELLVGDGTHVSAGDLLVRLDPTEAQSTLAAVTKLLWELTARRTRLEAERDGSETVEFPSDLLSAAEDSEIARIVSGERKLFDLRRDAQGGQKAQLRERITQLSDEVAGLTEQAAAKNKEIDLVQQELGGVRELWQKSLIPITRLTALERDAARLEGERGLLGATIAQTRGKISEIELQIIQLDQNMRSDVAKELGDIRAKMSELVEKKVTATEQLKRIDIRAPQSGTVHQLAVHTKGGVIGAGEQIMLIVPEADTLIVEIKVAPRDIDQVRLEQDVILRFTSFNQRTTPELTGTVSRIGADTIKEERNDASYYLVRVTLNPGEIERLGDRKLVPGMPVEAFVKTKDRTMLSYFLKPLTDQAQRAFREN
jgi:HlyD family secretion protein